MLTEREKQVLKLLCLTNSEIAQRLCITAITVKSHVRNIFNNLPVAESTKVFSFPYPADKNRFHPSQKPIELFKILIKRKSNENDLVLDCFSGSGTTAIACHNLKRNFICIEKDEMFYKKSVERLKNVECQTTLF